MKSKSYLPLHPRMMNSIFLGLSVAHNGGNGRQGWKGKVTGINLNSEKHFARITFNNNIEQWYSKFWFEQNIWACTRDIAEMHPFKGKPYVAKYGHYAVGEDAFPSNHSVRIDHELMKKQVDTKRKQEEQEAKRQQELALEQPTICDECSNTHCPAHPSNISMEVEPLMVGDFTKQLLDSWANAEKVIASLQESEPVKAEEPAVHYEARCDGRIIGIDKDRDALVAKAAEYINQTGVDSVQILRIQIETVNTVVLEHRPVAVLK